MKTVYVAHPIGGDVENNVKMVLLICQQLSRLGVIPVAPYLGALQYLDDNVPTDRQLGMEANLECLRRRYVDEVLLFGNRVSSGMEIEIRLALELGIPVIPMNDDVGKDFMRLFPKT